MRKLITNVSFNFSFFFRHHFPSKLSANSASLSANPNTGEKPPF